MRLCLLIAVASAFAFLGGCASEPDRKPIGPQGSQDGDMPWNRPRAGEGQGAFGGVFDRQ
jgi:hypothetical protein